MMKVNRHLGTQLAQLVFTGVILGLIPAAAVAQEMSHESMGMDVKVVMKTTVGATEKPLTLPKGQAEITEMLLTIQPGGHTNLHQHPVPIVVYVMEGELETHIDGVVRKYKAGEAVVEPQDMLMQAANPGSVPTKLLAVAIGEEGKPISIAAQ